MAIFFILDTNPDAHDVLDGKKNDGENFKIREKNGKLSVVLGYCVQYNGNGIQGNNSDQEEVEREAYAPTLSRRGLKNPV